MGELSKYKKGEGYGRQKENECRPEGKSNFDSNWCFCGAIICIRYRSKFLGNPVNNIRILQKPAATLSGTNDNSNTISRIVYRS